MTYVLIVFAAFFLGAALEAAFGARATADVKKELTAIEMDFVGYEDRVKQIVNLVTARVRAKL